MPYCLILLGFCNLLLFVCRNILVTAFLQSVCPLLSGYQANKLLKK